MHFRALGTKLNIYPNVITYLYIQKIQKGAKRAFSAKRTEITRKINYYIQKEDKKWLLVVCSIYL